jgi:pimeloyl-ACP methyl ester carboxylesterase
LPDPISRRDVLTASAAFGITASARAAGAPSAQQPTTRRSFVLVHGAFSGGWCYSEVADILRAKGHRVFTPTHTGVGERSHLANLGTINCSTHIQDIVNVIKWERLNDVILCGHSYGGMVIGGVADAIPDLIASLVYVDAAIPEDGKSLFDLISPPEQVLFLVNSTGENGGQLCSPLPGSHSANPAVSATPDARITRQSLATFTERLKLSGAHLSIRKKTFVLATNWEGNPARVIYERVKKDKSWSAIEVHTGHNVELEAPDRLAEILLASM